MTSFYVVACHAYHGVEEGLHAASASICSFYAFADAFKRRSIEVAPFERECMRFFSSIDDPRVSLLRLTLR